MSFVKPQITATQIVLMLFLSRVFTTLNYVPIFAKDIDLTAQLIGNLIGMIVALVLIIPIIKFTNKFKGQHIILVAMQKNKIIGTLIGVSFALLILLDIVGSLVGFEFFMTNVIYPSTSIIFIVISIAIFCTISAYVGLEGIARASTIVFIILMVGFIFIFVVAAKSVNMLNIKPILDNAATQVFNATFKSISKFSDLYLLLLLAPNIKGGLKKPSITFVVTASLFVETITFFLITVLGQYAYTQTYPYYTLASITETNQLQRLDSIHMALWVIVSFVKITLYIIVADNCIRRIFPKLKKLISFSIIFIITTIPAIVIGYHPEIIRYLNSTSGIIVIIFSSIIPMLLCINKTKKGDNHVKENLVVDSSVG